MATPKSQLLTLTTRLAVALACVAGISAGVARITAFGTVADASIALRGGYRPGVHRRRQQESHRRRNNERELARLLEERAAIGLRFKLIIRHSYPLLPSDSQTDLS